MRKKITAATAACLLTISSVAAAQSTSPLGIAEGPAAVRAGASVESADELGVSTGLYIGGGILLGLLLLAVVAEMLDDNDDGPASP